MYWSRFTYRIGYEKEEIHQRIKDLIDFEEENTFWNHFSPSSKISGRGVTARGNFKDQDFVFWRGEGWGGSFYPIYKGRLFSHKGENYLKLSIRFNPFAELLVVLLTLGWVYFVFFGGNTHPPIENYLFWLIKGGGTFLVLLFFQMVPLLGFIPDRKQTLKDLKKYLKLKRVRKRKA